MNRITDKKEEDGLKENKKRWKREMSKDKTFDELIEAWRMGDKEKVEGIIDKNPDLMKMLDLVKKKENHSFYKKHRDLVISIFFSILLSGFFVGTYDSLELRFGYLPSILLLALLLILVSTGFSLLVSFEFRSLKLSAFSCIGITLFSPFFYNFLKSYETYSMLNEITPFWLYFLTKDMGYIVGIGIFLLILSVVPVFASIYITRLLIGIPNVDEPDKISLNLPKMKVEEIKNTINFIMGTHFMIGKFKEQNTTNRWYGKFSTENDLFDVDQKHVSAVELVEYEDKVTLKMIFYTKQGFFTKIIRTQFCNNIGYEIGTSLKVKFTGATLSTDNNFENLNNFALGYTRNRFIELTKKVWNKILVNKLYVFIGIMVILVLVVYLIKKEIVVELGAVATVLTAIFFFAQKFTHWKNKNQNLEKPNRPLKISLS